MEPRLCLFVRPRPLESGGNISVLHRHVTAAANGDGCTAARLQAARLLQPDSDAAEMLRPGLAWEVWLWEASRRRPSGTGPA